MFNQGFHYTNTFLEAVSTQEISELVLADERE